MKYKTAKQIIQSTHSTYEIDDLLIFKKPFKGQITIHLKKGDTMSYNTQDYTYISLSYNGFLFIKDNHTTPVALKDVKDITLK